MTSIDLDTLGTITGGSPATDSTARRRPATADHIEPYQAIGAGAGFAGGAAAFGLGGGVVGAALGSAAGKWLDHHALSLRRVFGPLSL